MHPSWSISKTYMAAVLLGGLAAIGWTISYLVGSPMDTGQLVLMEACAATATLAYVRKVEGATPRSSYDLGLAVFGFAFIALGPEQAVIVLLVGLAVDWLVHRTIWYIQAFNICSLAVTTTLAGLVYGWTDGLVASVALARAVSIVSAIAVFVVLNHVMVALVIWLKTGESPGQSGVLGSLTLMIDAALVAAGCAAALVWLTNPYALVLTLAPVYLISATLKVPSLERQATTDPKTGVFNARYFQDALARELARANRFDRPLTVVMGDLDFLRNINNVYGHLAGDEVLKGVARILRESVRTYDVVARFGGEEFTILMTETSLEEALTRVEAMRSAIEAARFEVPTSVEPIAVTMSFGIAQRGAGAAAPDRILHEADVAVYRAKIDGRNRVRIAGEGEGSAVFPGQTPYDPPRESYLLSAVELPAAELPSEASPRDASEIAAAVGSSHAAGASESSRGEGEAGNRGSGPAETRTRPRLPLQLLIVLTAVAAAVGLTFSLGVSVQTDWQGILLFTAICVLAESLAIDIYTRDTSVSTSAAPFIAGALLLGPVGALVLSAGLAAASMIKNRSSSERLLFNASSHLLAALACVEIGRLVGGFLDQPIWVEFGVSVLAAGVVYVVTTGFVTAAISLDSGQSFKYTWSQHFAWLAPYYAALGAAGFALLFGYKEAGVGGLLTLLAPLVIIRFGQRQYLARTKDMVAKLRIANLESQQKAGEINALNEELLLLLSSAVDLRDPYVLGHSRHVAQYAATMGRALGFPPKQVVQIRKAGLLHDIGKLAVPESVLLKEGPLSDSEFGEMKRHPGLAEDIFKGSRILEPLLPTIRHHHERFDGTGYPGGLKGMEIPLEARILAVADAVEAMASDRSYRPAVDNRRVLEELRRNAGTQFDPELVEVMCDLVENGQISIVNSTYEVLVQTAGPWASVRPGAASWKSGPLVRAR